MANPDSVAPLGPQVAFYAQEIEAAYRQSLEGLIRVGELLLEAKRELPHGDFEQMVKSRCPFGPRQARKLMSIAGNRVLANRTHATDLPNSVETLANLAGMDEKELGHAVRNHWVKPDMTREDVKPLRQRVRKALGRPARTPRPAPKPSVSISFPVLLGRTLPADLTDWLSNLDSTSATTVAERVVELLYALREEQTDG